MPESTDLTRVAPRRDAVVLGLVVAVIGSLCVRRALWGPDAAALLQMVQQGADAHWMHLLYVPIARAVLRVGEALGVEPVRAIAATSALGVAIGVALLHRAAAALGATRGPALVTALLAGTTPAVVFFGLLLEIQGVFFAFAGLAWLAAAGLAQRPAALRVALLGVSTGLAAMAHSSAHLLPILLATFALTRMPRAALRPPRLLLWLVVGAIAHATPALVIELTTDLPALENLRRSFSLASGTVVDDGLSPWAVLRNEWLLAFAPIAVTCYLALRCPTWRRTLLWLQPALLLYLAVAWRVLSTSWTQQDTEHGAYLLPFAFPFAWLTVRGLGARAAIWLAPLALFVAVATLHAELEQRVPTADPRALVAAIGDPRGVVIVADQATADAVLLEAPGMVALRLDQVLQTPDSMLRVTSVFDQQFAALRDARRTVAFETRVLGALDAAGLPLPEHLRSHYRLEQRTADGVAVIIVRPPD